MSYLISTRGPGPYMRCNRSAWGSLLAIGQENGWQPAGTELQFWPEGDFVSKEAEDAVKQARENAKAAWDGNYSDTGGQLVTARDSANLLAALQKARIDIVDDHCAVGSYTERCTMNPTLDALLIDLIVICEYGAFRIW